MKIAILHRTKESVGLLQGLQGPSHSSLGEYFLSHISYLHLLMISVGSFYGLFDKVVIVIGPVNIQGRPFFRVEPASQE